MIWSTEELITDSVTANKSSLLYRCACADLLCLVLCIMTKHLHCGLTCQEETAPKRSQTWGSFLFLLFDKPLQACKQSFSNRTVMKFNIYHANWSWVLTVLHGLTLRWTRSYINSQQDWRSNVFYSRLIGFTVEWCSNSRFRLLLMSFLLDIVFTPTKKFQIRKLPNICFYWGVHIWWWSLKCNLVTLS